MEKFKRKVKGLWSSVTLQVKQPAEPQPLEGRPMTGLFTSLTADQQVKALEYRGPENHGHAEFVR